MSLEFIIDGYNVVKHPSYNHGHGIKDGRISLINLIQREHLCGSPKNRARVVFDGYPDGGLNFNLNAGVEVAFSQDSSADDLIKEFIERSVNPRVLVVVSDDRDIRSSAACAGATAMGVEEFIAPRKKRSSGSGRRLDPVKNDLNYTQMDAINKELKERWLG